MSYLANSCEYLTSDKLCLAVSESEKAKTARQVRCKNEEKSTCCYLCMLVMDCPTPCRFLGNSENEVPQQIDYEKPPFKGTAVSEQKLEENQTKKASVACCCSLCNIEMSQARTRLNIHGWEGSRQKSDGDYSKWFGEGELPVIVYLCPKCGKIDLRAEEKPNKK